MGQEETHIWQKRKARVRDFQTDALFADNLGSALLDQIIQEVLRSQPSPSAIVRTELQPGDLAPWEVLFRQGEIYERLPTEDYERGQHHLEEIKVVLIKRMISDQLPYIGVAKRIFTIRDLRYIYERRIGSGKIGGKAAGLMLAWRILQQDMGDGNDIHPYYRHSQSYFIGTEVIYEFRLMNNLDHFMNQKYRSLAEIRDEYPHIVEAHLAGQIPAGYRVISCANALADLGDSPLIVRSSSLLEDNFGFAFAGKYNSYFCPNQGTPEQNLRELLDAVRRVFASTLNPDAILYRQKHGLIDYDERMAMLIQKAVGKPVRPLLLSRSGRRGLQPEPIPLEPTRSGARTAFCASCGASARAPSTASATIIHGLSPSAIPNCGRRRPPKPSANTRNGTSTSSTWRTIASRPSTCATSWTKIPLPALHRLDQPERLPAGDFLRRLYRMMTIYPDLQRPDSKDRSLCQSDAHCLQRLEATYQRPVDVEFGVDIMPKLSQHGVSAPRAPVPAAEPARRRQRRSPSPRISRRSDPVHVEPSGARRPRRGNSLHRLRRSASLLQTPRHDDQARAGPGHRPPQQAAGERKLHLLMGPGRWGSVNIDLGVHVTYADIFNTRVLVEMAVAHNGHIPELSYGTHFFQDLVEAGIHSLALHLGAGPESGAFNQAILRRRPQRTWPSCCPKTPAWRPILKVIDLAERAGRPASASPDERRARRSGRLSGNMRKQRGEPDDSSNKSGLRTYSHPTPSIGIYIKLAQYPILADRRARSHAPGDYSNRGIVNPDKFEHEVRE
jgi:hypothetical protein